MIRRVAVQYWCRDGSVLHETMASAEEVDQLVRAYTAAEPWCVGSWYYRIVQLTMTYPSPYTRSGVHATIEEIAPESNPVALGRRPDADAVAADLDVGLSCCGQTYPTFARFMHHRRSHEEG